MSSSAIAAISANRFFEIGTCMGREDTPLVSGLPGRYGDRGRCLFEDSSEASEHVVHDGFGDGFEAIALAGSEIEGAGLVATDYAGRSCARLLKRNGEAAPARETPARGDGQDDGRSGDFVESARGNDQYRPCALLFMAGRRIEGDEPDVAALHYKSSLPTGLSSIQARSPSDGVSVSSHCARSSWSV